MTDDKIITTIRNSGGWCQLHQSSNTSLLDTLGGRLVLYSMELSYIEKFDLNTGKLDGYIVFFNNSRQRLKKAPWIKKILTLGGKTIPDTVLPESLIAETVQELMRKLQSSREPLFIRLFDKILQGRIYDFSDTDLLIEPASTPMNGKDYNKVSYSDIVCLELRTKEIQRLWSRRTSG